MSGAKWAAARQPPPFNVDVGRYSRLGLRALWLLLVYAGFMAWFGFSTLTLRAVGLLPPSLVQLVAFSIALLAMGCLWWCRRALSEGLNRFMDGLAAMPGRGWLLACLAVGLILRLTWALTFHGLPNSDGATYLSLAKAMLAGQDYAVGGARAYWPPGYPLFLIPWLVLFDIDRWAILAGNAFLFVVSVLGVRALARFALDAGTERVAIMLVCIWPNLIFQAGMPEKEQLLVALMPWILATAVSAAQHARPSMAASLAAVSGVLLGAANLVQPAFILFPVVLIGLWAIAVHGGGRKLLLSLAIVVGAAASIAPWTLRNFEIFDRFVLISTNGGIGLYGANNPRAGGGYFEHWADTDLLQMDELTADREGRYRALDWIKSNPGAAAKLAFEKNIRFMGDDSVAAYQTLKRGAATQNTLTYLIFKGCSNVFWLAIWSLMLAPLLVGVWRNPPANIVWIAAAAGFIYGFTLHSLAESAGKYHVYAIGLLCLLFPCVVRGSRATTNTAS